MSKGLPKTSPTAIQSAIDVRLGLQYSVPWTAVLLSEPLWPVRHKVSNGLRKIDLSKPLGKDISLLSPSHFRWRQAFTESMKFLAATRGYGPNDGSDIVPLANQHFALFSWMIQTGWSIEDVGPDLADDYACYCAARPSKQSREVAKRQRSAEASLSAATTQASQPTEMAEAAFEKSQDSVEEALLVDTVSALLAPLEHIWNCRAHLPFHLKADPFPEGRFHVASKHADASDYEAELIPLEFGCRLLQGAIDVATELVPLIPPNFASSNEQSLETKKVFASIEARAKELSYEFRIFGHPRSVREFKSSSSTPALLWTSFLETLIPHAFFVVASSFTLGRPGEFCILQTGSISGDQENGFWHERYIEKNYQQVRGSPVHPFVARSVFNMEALLAVRRSELQSTFLLPKRSRSDFETRSLKTFDSAGLRMLGMV